MTAPTPRETGCEKTKSACKRTDRIMHDCAICGMPVECVAVGTYFDTKNRVPMEKQSHRGVCGHNLGTDEENPGYVEEGA